MTFKASYKGEQMILPNIECECGLPHKNPEMDIYIGEGLIDKCGAYIKKKELGDKVLVVTDNVVEDIAGNKVVEILTDSGFTVEMCVLTREEELVPDQTALGEVLLAMEDDVDFLAAVGSGSINDITRYLAFHTKRPFVSIGTAPSMDGYTSVIAPLIYNDLKVNKPAVCPEVLICDLEIMKKAPADLIISGFGDVVGKYIAIADWKLGRIINNEQYCPVNADIVFQAVEKCMSNIEGIKKRTVQGIKSLIEALILAGVTILIIENTRAVSSIEHAMGHYLEMMKLLREEKPARHGITVGVTTGYALRFYEQFLNKDFNKIDIDEIKDNRQSKAEWKQTILGKYGPRIGPLILEENSDEYLEWPEQKRRIEVFLSKLEKSRKELDFLPEWSELKEIYQELGLPLTAEEIGVDNKLFKDTLLYAKDYRERYNVFKTANELDLLEEIVEEIVGSEDKAGGL